MHAVGHGRQDWLIVVVDVEGQQWFLVVLGLLMRKTGRRTKKVGT
jgi:hypothetical protein